MILRLVFFKTILLALCQSKIFMIEIKPLIFHFNIDIFLVLLFFQTSMLDYFKIQLVFHAKAIEFYSKCFESMSMVDEERDLQVRLKL